MCTTPSSVTASLTHTSSLFVVWPWAVWALTMCLSSLSTLRRRCSFSKLNINSIRHSKTKSLILNADFHLFQLLDQTHFEKASPFKRELSFIINAVWSGTYPLASWEWWWVLSPDQMTETGTTPVAFHRHNSQYISQASIKSVPAGNMHTLLMSVDVRPFLFLSVSVPT